MKMPLFPAGITLFIAAACNASAAPPVIHAIDQHGERPAVSAVPVRPVHAVPAASTPSAPEDALASLLNERTPDEVRVWLLQQWEVDQAIFAPKQGIDPLRALAAPDLFAPRQVKPAAPNATPLAPDAPATTPVIRGTLTNPIPMNQTAPARLPLPQPALRSAPTSTGRRIGPSPEAKQYAHTARLNPTVFAPDINRATGQFRLDPALLRAVAHVESGFNPKARSDKGAAGLMQLMPATARQRGVAAPHDSGQNLIGGSQHLAWILTRYSGNTALALAAYNAGKGTVDRYGGIPPYRKTIDYAEKVMTLWNRYLTPSTPKPPLEIRRVHANHPGSIP